LSFKTVSNTFFETLRAEDGIVWNSVYSDLVQVQKIEQGKKAYALGFTLQDENKTLTDEEIDKTMTKLMNAFEGKMGAIIRK